ncbi:MAG TPA: AMP-binding protein [Steroidobacteraceae bacterium]
MSSAGTVFEAFEHSAARWGARPFLLVLDETAAVYGIEPREYTYAEVARNVRELRGLYSRAGYGSGQRVGLLLENRPGYLFHWLALNALGVSVVPISPDWRSAELEYLVTHSEIAAAVTLPDRAVQLAEAAMAAGRALALVAADGSNVPGAPAQPRHAGVASNRRTECALLYTSGTTGRPKGCMLPNEYFLWAGQWYAELDGLCELRPGMERMITPLPVTHMNAMACSVMSMMLTGGCLILLDRFHPRTWWDSVRRSQATVMHYLGVMPAMLLGAPASAEDRQHALRFGFGAGVNPRHHAAFEERFGLPLLEAWAMTETGAGAAVIANREPRNVGTACFGKAEPRVEYRVVDADGHDVPCGEPGELLVRSAGPEPRFGFFAGYLKDEQATDDAWQGGYFHTGDLVRVDGDGQFRFVDRRRNLIRRSGENISAVEVESVLAQHPAVAAAGVTAVPDAVRGDEVMACIVTRCRAGVALDPARLAGDIVEFCMERLAYYKAPGYVAFCESVPLTSTETIQRGQLGELGRTLLDEQRCLDMRALKKRRA